MQIILGPPGLEKEFQFRLINFLGGLTYPGVLGKFTHFGVYTSGGLDSTMMLCILLTELKNINKLNDIEVTCFTVCKTSGSTYYADRMVKLVSDIFQKKLNHVSNIDNPLIHMHPTPLVGTTMDDISKQHKNVLFFTGLHKHPDKNLKVFEYNQEFSYHDNTSMRLNRIVNPFTELNKFHILDLYYKLNFEHLITYSHSCVKDPIGVCNQCTNCEERTWAFHMLNKPDVSFVRPDIADISFNNSWKTSIRDNSSVG